MLLHASTPAFKQFTKGDSLMSPKIERFAGLQGGVSRLITGLRSTQPSTPWVVLGTAAFAFFVPPIFITLIGEDMAPLEKIIAGTFLLPGGAINAVIAAWLTSKIITLAVKSEDYIFIAFGTGAFALLTIAYVVFLAMPEPQFEPSPASFVKPQFPHVQEREEISPKELRQSLRAVLALMLCGANLGAFISALSVVIVRSTTLGSQPVPQQISSKEVTPAVPTPSGEAFPVGSGAASPSPPSIVETPAQPTFTPLNGAVFTGSEASAEREATPPPLLDQTREQEAQRLLRDAVRTYNTGRREDGIELLRAVVQTYPGTKAARTAQGHLAKLDRA
jgi:hypothetical protein